MEKKQCVDQLESLGNMFRGGSEGKTFIAFGSLRSGALTWVFSCDRLNLGKVWVSHVGLACTGSL